MIDVHVPHKSDHTWTDFFIHIGTIAVGLLIAIGLEQTVEYFHHRHQAAELRENLHAESEQILSDTDRCIGSMQYRVTWLNARIDQVKLAVWHHQPLPAAAPFSPPGCAAPDNPIWRTAKASGLAFYLTKGEVTAYSEIEYVVSHELDRVKPFHEANSETNQFLAIFPSLPNGQPDLSFASPDDLRKYLALLTEHRETLSSLLFSLHLVRGATRAVTAGETRLNAIYAAERDDLSADTLMLQFKHD